MDPVSVFNALYDTKCLKFGEYQLKSGLVAPYYINLRRLSLYPQLMDAIVSQVVDKFLDREALILTSSQVQRKDSIESQASSIGEAAEQLKFAQGKHVSSTPTESDADSQLEEDDIETSSQKSLDCAKLRSDLDPIICGVPCGAVPIGAAVAYKAGLPYLLERKDDKDYGDKQCLMADFNDETRSYASTDDSFRSGTARRQRVILIEDVICSGASILNTVQTLERRNLKVEFIICIVDREENGVNLLLQEGIHVFSLYKISAILRILEATGRISHEKFMRIKKWISTNQFEFFGVDPSKRRVTSPAKSPAVSGPTDKTPINRAAIEVAAI